MTALPQPIASTDPRERFLDVAWSIGARLCRDAIWDGDRCNWLGDSMGFLEGALGGFAYERKCFSTENQNWPDFRSFASPNAEQLGYSLAWCHGAPGIGLSRLRAFTLTGDETYKREAEAAIGGTYRPLMMPSQAENCCLCHGLGGNAELFIVAADLLNDERYRGVAESVGDRGIQSTHMNRNPWPCGVLGGGESPNLLLGTAGIGYFYLRLYDSAAVPSVLLVNG